MSRKLERQVRASRSQQNKRQSSTRTSESSELAGSIKRRPTRHTAGFDNAAFLPDTELNAV